jgi:hypothetical protein
MGILRLTKLHGGHIVGATIDMLSQVRKSLGISASAPELEKWGAKMVDLSNEEIKALARAVNLEIKEPELTHVAYSLNAILEAMNNIDIPGLNSVEPLPIILPEESLGK